MAADQLLQLQFGLEVAIPEDSDVFIPSYSAHNSPSPFFGTALQHLPRTPGYQPARPRSSWRCSFRKSVSNVLRRARRSSRLPIHSPSPSVRSVVSPAAHSKFCLHQSSCESDRENCEYSALQHLRHRQHHHHHHHQDTTSRSMGHQTCWSRTPSPPLSQPLPQPSTMHRRRSQRKSSAVQHNSVDNRLHFTQSGAAGRRHPVMGVRMLHNQVRTVMNTISPPPQESNTELEQLAEAAAAAAAAMSRDLDTVSVTSTSSGVDELLDNAFILDDNL